MKSIIATTLTAGVAFAQPTLIPAPQSYTEGAGTTQITPATVIVHDAKLASEAKLLAEKLRTTTGCLLPLVPESKDTPAAAIILDLHDAEASSYTLNSSGSQITIKGGDPAGVFYGTQTLLQLLPAETAGSDIKRSNYAFKDCSITDKPAFPWRGMHLDESRHFFGKTWVKRYIDTLAAHKMNVFHWHLIDDGGWRLEIKQYPKLTQLGGYRKGTSKGWKVNQLEVATSPEDFQSGDWYGGYHTQEDIKEIVAYAAARHVRVIPEIEMPGHSLPAISNYPELKCGGDLVSDSQGWTPSTQNSYCAGKESTYTFLENVLKEVFTLFPDEYVHIGGDEVIKEFWAQCPHCQAKKKAEGLKNENELQSYLVQRMEKFLNANGKKLIGWDEITHGGLTPNATVMFWIGMGAVNKTAELGHDIIMTPMGPCYFDFAYKNNSTEKVYQWELVPEQWIGTPREKQFLGSQGNIWTEWMEDYARVEFMTLPRMLALSENLWTKREKKDLANFLTRLDAYYPRLDAMGYNYRIPSPRPIQSAMIFESSAQAAFHPAPAGFEIRFTTDGSPVNAQSPLYSEPFTVDETLTVKAKYFNGARSSEAIATIDCVKYQQPNTTALEPGLTATYAEGKWNKVPDFSKLTNTTKHKVSDLSLGIRKRNDNFSILFEGFLTIENEGIHTFTLASDDGSYLKVAGAKVVDHDGKHGYSPKSGTIHLKPGTYPIELGYLEAGGAEVLDAFITAPNQKEQKLTAPHFQRAK
ncbi:family 20 glycosylhydrolase [Rubritalea tangerina]|uniref:beta-N-acetylhexosaminidase n=1 Tax=Rubritalea tangerina TaxID=430798 RepID=A0ABW4ZCM8_9BACT